MLGALRRPNDPPGEDVTAVGRRPGHAGLLRLLIPVLAVGALGIALHRVEPPPPGPFYDPPAPLPPGPAGALLRQEPVADAPEGARAWRVLYLSTDSEDRPVPVSGVVVAPEGPAPPGGRPVVAWAHPSTGISSRCAPSLGPDAGTGAIPGLDALLDAGYVVTATDYPGLGTAGPHPYLVGEAEGRAVLDSVRAARALTDAGAGARTALWGHSQGGHAALFAGQLAPTYSPDVPLAGIATAAPATDLTALLQHDIGSAAGNVLGSLALVSWSRVYADRGVHLDDVVEPVSGPIARRIAERCVEPDSQLAVDLPAAEVLRLRFLRSQPWNVAGWDDLLAENTPGAVPPSAPVLVAQGTADTLVWRDVTTSWVTGQCDRRADVTLRLYDEVSHTAIARRAANDAVAWLGDRFAGRAAAGCR
jgi:alpha-beta hydrolase superfamily lysophospholipase